MAGATVAPALPSIAEHFKAHDHADLLVRLVLTIPALFIGLGAPWMGKLLERMGRLPVFRFGLLLYALAGSAPVWIPALMEGPKPVFPSYGWIDGLTLILLSRALLGVAVAALMTATTTLAGDYLQGEERNRFLGFQGSFMAFGGVVFISLGGWLASLSWQAPFGLYVAAILLLPASWKVLFEPSLTDGADRTDTPNQQEDIPWARVLTIYLGGFFGMLMFYAIPTQVPFYLEHQLEVPPVWSGLMIASSTLAAASISYHYARIRRRLRFPLIFTLAFALLSAGYLSIGLAYNAWTVVPALMLSGTGAGLTMPNANLWLISTAPDRARGMLMGGMTAAIFMGQFLSPVLMAPVRKSLSTGQLFESLSVIILLASLIYFWFDRKQSRKVAASGYP